jgi:hypothetical protein
MKDMASNDMLATKALSIVFQHLLVEAPNLECTIPICDHLLRDEANNLEEAEKNYYNKIGGILTQASIKQQEPEQLLPTEASATVSPPLISPCHRRS